ncbi:hypothetical protein OK016_14285 [Vibrio chagasii]|nr:hypothetical protein [Vibrio chagasii]
MAVYLIQKSLGDLMQLSMDVYPQNIFHALDIFACFILLISCSLLIVVASISHSDLATRRSIRMTKQKLKDNSKDIISR